MSVFKFTVFERDEQRPWVLVGEPQHLEVELAHADAFHDWAAEHWPEPRWTATLDPGQEKRRMPV